MTDQCPQCGGNLSDTDSDTGIALPENKKAICTTCGYVVDGSEPDIANDSEEDSPTEESSTWSDVSKVSNGWEANIVEGLDELEGIADKLGISKDSREQAAELYREAVVEGSTDGRETRRVVAALLYIASRSEGEPRPPAEFTSLIDLDKKYLNSTVKTLHRELDIEQTLCSPSDYVPYLSHKLGLSEEEGEGARRILSSLSPRMTNGRSPASFAAAALYMASERGDITQRDLAEASGVTGETIRVRLRELEQERSATETFGTEQS